MGAQCNLMAIRRPFRAIHVGLFRHFHVTALHGITAAASMQVRCPHGQKASALQNPKEGRNRFEMIKHQSLYILFFIFNQMFVKSKHLFTIQGVSKNGIVKDLQLKSLLIICEVFHANKS